MTTLENASDCVRRATVLILTRDLFFQVRLESAVSRAGWTPLVVRPADDVESLLDRVGPALALVDLQASPETWRAALAAARVARSGPVPAVAFGSHKDLSVRKEALAAGATVVVANSKLVSDLPALLGRYATSSPDAG